jgi:synaptic vesicle membrane protein VAT-1
VAAARGLGSPKREETVLVHNVGGGVGLAAINIARHIGSTIYGTASSAKHAFLFERGVHEAIDYRAKDWVVELDRLTNGKGVALIADPLGGNHWKKSCKALRSTGRLGMFGLSVATTSKLPGPLRLLPLALMNANKSVFGVNLGHMWHESDMIAGCVEILLKGVADGWVRPHVDKSFPLAQAGEAQTYIEERKNIGKVVLTT